MSTVTSSGELAESGRKSGKKCILVTGGAGYVGSHTVVELLENGYRVCVLEVFDNSSPEALRRVREISGCAEEELLVAEVDLLDLAACEKMFKRFGPFDACIHFAGLKAVGESVKIPLHYYGNNLTGTMNLVHLLDKYGCHAMAFSSSATVYGLPKFTPITEDHPLGSTNPYGKTKHIIEEILGDVAISEPAKWSIALLRYFNPIGAHPSGIIGEDPKGTPNNLVPYVAQVAIGRLKELSVFGNDYDTPDGTGVRDYIHVVDLAKGHLAAMKKVLGNKGMGAHAYNLGTGKGSSVLEVVAAMEKATGKTIPYKLVPRRAGDVPIYVADPTKAKMELGWEATIGIEQMTQDTWRWQTQNPNGFRTDEEVSAAEDSERRLIIFNIYKN